MEGRITRGQHTRIQRRRSRWAVLRLGGATLFVLAFAGCDAVLDVFEGPSAAVGPELWLEQKCGYLHVTLHTEPNWVVRHTQEPSARADESGLAELLIPSGRFEEPLVTLDLSYGLTGNEWHLVTRQVLGSDPDVHLEHAELGRPPDKSPILAYFTDSCGSSGYTSRIGKFESAQSNRDLGTSYFEIAVVGARRVQTRDGEAEKLPVDPKGVSVVRFRPDWPRLLAESDLRKKASARLRVEGERQSWIDVSFELDFSATKEQRFGYLLAQAFARYSRVGSTPLPNAPAYSAEAKLHPTLLFEGTPEEGDPPVARHGRPYLRAALLGDGRVSDVQMVAYYEKSHTRVGLCPGPEPDGKWPAVESGPSEWSRAVDYARYRAIQWAHDYVVSIYEARTGALAEKKEFHIEPGKCGVKTEPGGYTDPRGVFVPFDIPPFIRELNDTRAEDMGVVLDEEVMRWLESWAGAKLLVLGPRVYPGEKR